MSQPNTLNTHTHTYLVCVCTYNKCLWTPPCSSRFQEILRTIPASVYSCSTHCGQTSFSRSDLSGTLEGFLFLFFLNREGVAEEKLPFSSFHRWELTNRLSDFGFTYLVSKAHFETASR